MPSFIEPELSDSHELFRILTVFRPGRNSPGEVYLEGRCWPGRHGHFDRLQAADERFQDRLYGLYAVLLGCGLRIGEALALSWSDWDAQRGALTVRRQLTEVAGELFFAEPKTAKGKRTVRLPGFVSIALEEHRARMQAEGHELNDHLLIFVDTEGNPLRRSNLRRRSFATILKRAGLPHCRLHDLRHTCASLHLRQGTSPVVVQQMLGHSRVSITLDRYSHALPILQEEAAARLDALLIQQKSEPSL